MSLDLLSGFPTPKNGYDCIVAFTDRLSKYAFISPCHKTSWIRRHSVTPLTFRAYKEFLSAHVEYLQRIADRSSHKVDMSRALAAKKHLVVRNLFLCFCFLSCF